MFPSDKSRFESLSSTIVALLSPSVYKRALLAYILHVLMKVYGEIAKYSEIIHEYI